MIKYIFSFLLFFSTLYGKNYYSKIVENAYISEDFKIYKDLQYSEYQNKKINKFSIRLDLKNIKKNTYYMTVVSDIDSLVYTNLPYIRQNNILILKIDKNTPEKIFFNYSYKQAKIAEFRINLINEFEYKYLLHYEGILYGLAYGIIFSAFLYYLIIYISSRRKCFLYYSLMQFFVLLSLVGFVYCSFKSYPNEDFIYTQAFVDIFETLGFLFTLLFAKEILNTRKIMPKTNIVLNFFVLLNVLDILAISYYKYSILYEYMPFSFGFLVPAFAGFIAILNKNKYAIIYTLGWGLMFILILLIENYYFPISGIYAIHLVAPLESLVFSFALALMLREIVNEQNEKEKLLIHKSKLASMGEMINNIAHQWRQPLTHLSFINMNLQLASTQELSKEFVNEKIEESNEQIEFMSKTIDSFRDFYKPTKEKEIFWVAEAVKKSIEIIKPLLEIYSIQIKLEVIKDKQIKSYENEYCQVILNLLTNAKDELINKKVNNASISIKVDVKNNKSEVKVCDNAGGISLKNINKIFEPYFSTKENGSGIGLYMSKTIIDSHFKGELLVSNEEEGACFKILV